ncbi:MAG: hypothetical protein DI530_12280 [Sphingomonas sp.]|uniref:tyrosine-type recombinase/integrase n=1 Tax=Sphingomonas sp. TaxID=28214 RepID=UPI000DBC0C92|nr:site-specific integrase [Sphingomonas sp.]PZU77762.1 MAG: hypothetical protein DI530_12280 [Sphingomonas sp.]
MASVSKRRWTGADGKPREAWSVRWKDETGSHRQKTFEKKRDADKYRSFIEVDAYDGRGVSVSASYSIGDLTAEYLRASRRMEIEGKIAPATHKKECFYFERHIVPALGSITLRELSENHIDKWLTGLKHSKLRGSGDLRPATIKQLTQALGRALDMAVRRKMLATNVARTVGQWREHRHGKNEPIRTFTVEDVQRLLISIAPRDLGLTAKRKPRAREGWTRRSEAFVRCAVYAASFCGLRLGEFLALRWCDIDMEQKIIRVRHSLDVFDNLRTTKTKAGMRDVPMPKILADEFEAWRIHVAKEDRGLIFRTKSGGKLSTAGFHIHYWQPALEDAGLGPDGSGRRFHYHALRHFAASMMIAGGVPIPDVAKLLGHASFDVTLQVYAHPVMNTTRQHAAIEAIATTLKLQDAHGAHATDYLIEFAS